MTRKRPGNEEDRALWEQVAETVVPLRPRVRQPHAPQPGQPEPPPSSSHRRPAPPPPPPKSPPALAVLDRRSRGRVARGVVAIDRRVDLHGHTQIAAERELGDFLVRAQEDGARIVLIITGKGKPGEERGVLRRMVPLWLASPHWRHLVVGFEEAAPNHGGSGALYVRIRRMR